MIALCNHQSVLLKIFDFLSRNEEVEGSSPFSSSLKWAANEVILSALRQGGSYMVRTSLPQFVSIILR